MPPRWRSLSAPTRPRRWPRERAAAADRGAAPRGPEADQDGGRGPPNGRDPSEPRGSEALRGGREGPGRGAEGDRRDPADASAGFRGGRGTDPKCARPGPDALRTGDVWAVAER